MDTITKDCIVYQNDKKFLSSDLGFEIVIMDLENGDYVGLNEVASAIWKLMTEKIEVGLIIEELQKMYDVSPEICAAETLKSLEDMIQKEMVIVKYDHESVA